MGIGVAKWDMRRLLPRDGMVHEAPSAHATVGLIKDWITLFPADTGVQTNGIGNFFEDGRVTWGAERLGGIAALTCSSWDRSRAPRPTSLNAPVPMSPRSKPTSATT